MIIKETGKIKDDFYMLGHPTIPIFLLDGKNPAIFDGSFSFLGKFCVEKIKGILGPKQPTYFFLTHSHFDHCGAVSIFLKNFPKMKIICSERTKSILSRPNAVELIRNLNEATKQMAEQLVGAEERNAFSSDLFEPFSIDKTVKEGDIIKISPGLSVEIFETPGHTMDCISYYIPEKKILISSEALGIADATGYIYTECLVDYDLYLDSVKKLSQLDIDILCTAHYYIFTELDAKKFTQDAILQCEKFRKLVVKSLAENNENIKKVMENIKKIEYDWKEGLKQAELAYLLNLEARIKAIQKHTNK